MSCDAEGSSHEVVNLSQGQCVNGAYYYVQNPNACHSRFKLWLARFHGAATHYLTNCLGWRRALGQRQPLAPETLFNATLGNFQYVTVTWPYFELNLTYGDHKDSPVYSREAESFLIGSFIRPYTLSVL